MSHGRRPDPAPPARVSRGRALSVVGGRLVLIVALITGVALVASWPCSPGNGQQAAWPGTPPASWSTCRRSRRRCPTRPSGRSSTPPTARLPGHLWLDENRKVVPLKDIPRRVRDAVIAIEDDRFFEHDSVDFRGIARAAVTDMRLGGSPRAAAP